MTTQWSSLVEVLRGTDSWTPFVAPTATAGAPLVTGSGGHPGAPAWSRRPDWPGWPAGDARARAAGDDAADRGGLMAAGYSGGLGSPFAHQVQAFLDAGGRAAAQRAQAGVGDPDPAGAGLGPAAGPDIRYRAARRVSVWLRAFAHPERDKRVAVGIVMLTALAVSTSLAWTGRLTPPGTFSAIPQYWHEAADWLTEHNPDLPTGRPGRVLVVPGAPFATQVWGTSHDEPLQVLGNSPWGVRDSIPLTPPQTIRALDSVQRLFAAGGPSAGLADTLARQGISYVVVRNDLDPDDVALGAPDPGAPRHHRIAGTAEGGAVRCAGRARHAGGLRRRQRAAPALSRGGDLPRLAGGAPAIPARLTSPTSTSWPASTAVPRCCCGSTSGADCWASRRWVRC